MGRERDVPLPSSAATMAERKQPLDQCGRLDGRSNLTESFVYSELAIRMTELTITATGEALTINGRSWSDAPRSKDLCQIVGCDDLVDGGSVIVDGQAIARFRYFEDLGIAILESMPGGKVWRLAIYLELPPRTRLRKSQYKSYGQEGQRSPKKKFFGKLIIDGKELHPPFRYPMRGQLPFIPPRGPKVSVYVAVTPSEYVQWMGFEYKRETE